MSTYDAVKDLPLEIESYELEPLEREVARGFTLRRTVGRAARRRRRGPRRGGRLRPRRTAALPGAPWRAAVRGPPHTRFVLRPPVGADRVPPLGVRVGGARPGAAAGRAHARRGGRARGAAAPLRRLDPDRERRGLARALPRAALQARPRPGLERRDRLDARGRGRRRHRRLQGHLPRGVRLAAGPRAVRAHRRGVPGGVDRGPGADAGDAGRARAAPRADHLGRGDPRVERRRGAAVPSALPQLEAVAVRIGAAAVRLLRRVRARGHRPLRRRPVRARPRPRPDPAARLALPPGRAERRRAGRVQRERAGGGPAGRRRSHSARSRASEL